MKRTTAIISLLFASIYYVFPQLVTRKGQINNNTYKSWDALKNYDISPDGKYVSYSFGSDLNGQRLILSSSDNKYKVELAKGASFAKFSSDGKYAFFPAAGKIGIIKTGEKVITYLDNVDGFQYPNGGSDVLLISKKGCIAIRNFVTGKEIRFEGGKIGYFHEQGNAIVIKTATDLIYYDVKSSKSLTFCTDSTATNVGFDESGRQVAFITRSNRQTKVNYYKYGMLRSAVIADDKSRGIQKDYVIGDEPISFSRSGGFLFVGLELKRREAFDSLMLNPMVDIWSYRDNRLQSNQLYDLGNDQNRTYLAALNLSTKTYIQLENENIRIEKGFNRLNDYVILAKRVNEDESYWNISQQFEYELFSLGSQKRKKIVSSALCATVSLSPSEKYCTWFNKVDNNFYAYDIKLDRTIKLTSGISADLKLADEINQIGHSGPVTQIFWALNDELALVHDNFDIWQVDPQGLKKPFMITGGYGRRNNISLRIPSYMGPIIMDSKRAIIIAGLENDTKYNGFFKAALGTTKGIKPLLKAGPFLYFFPSQWFMSPPAVPIKANKSQTFALVRQSDVDAPNLEITVDFKKFVKITDIRPQANYNWLTTELIHWKGHKNIWHQGILYKPENFDQAKRYPVIFHYYQSRSNELFIFKNPGPTPGVIDVAWYVSNGYLVFIPDLTSRPGFAYQDVPETVESAVEYFSKFSWFNKNKIGLQGQSYGGYETNLIISRSNLFAAAQSSAGMSNLLSAYANLRFGDKSNQSYYEMGQGNMRRTLWERPDLYIENSPVMRADKISTPLLLQNCKADGDMYFQGVDMFSALRRLGKPVWMLQYDMGGHTIYGLDALDFTIRQQQFFGYYLKDEPAPLWMIEGVPAKYKGVRSGLGLDTSKR